MKKKAIKIRQKKFKFLLDDRLLLVKKKKARLMDHLVMLEEKQKLVAVGKLANLSLMLTNPK